MRTLFFSLLLHVSTASLSQEVPADSKTIADIKETYISSDSISAIIEPFVRKKAMIILDDKEITLKQFKSLNPKEYESPVILTQEVALEKFGKKGKNGVIELTSKSTVKTLPISGIKANESNISDIREQPEFPGGQSALLSYLASHLRYPPEIEAQGIRGKVLVDFWITKTGKVVMVKVVKAVHPFLDAEAIRVIREMPDWKPGTLNGRIVIVSCTLPLWFGLKE